MRVPVVIGGLDVAAPDDAVLLEGERLKWAGACARFVPARAHPVGCACCVARLPAAQALTALLHKRARREVAFFRRVVAVLESAAGLAELDAALLTDPVASACFRRMPQP